MCDKRGGHICLSSGKKRVQQRSTGSKSVKIVESVEGGVARCNMAGGSV